MEIGEGLQTPLLCLSLHPFPIWRSAVGPPETSSTQRELALEPDTAGLGRKSGSRGQARVSSLGREGPMPLRVLDGKEQAPHSISLSAPTLYQRAGPLVTHSSRVFV